MLKFDYSDEELIKAIIKSYKEGDTILNIQKKHHVSAGTIYRIIDTSHTPRRSKHVRNTKDVLERYTEEELDQIVLDKLAGMSLTEIYWKYDLTKNAFYVIWDSRLDRIDQEAKEKNVHSDIWKLVD